MAANASTETPIVNPDAIPPTYGKLLAMIFQNDLVPAEFYDAVTAMLYPPIGTRRFLEDIQTGTRRFLEDVFIKDGKLDPKAMNSAGLGGWLKFAKDYVKVDPSDRNSQADAIRTYFSDGKGIGMINTAVELGYPLGLDVHAVERLSGEFTTYVSFWRFGCPKSTDADVFVCRTDAGKQLYTSELRRLEAECAELGYPAGLDISSGCIEGGKIVDASKGGDYSAEIIRQTYDLHAQKYDPPQLDPVAIDYEQMLRSFAVFVWENLRDLIPGYKRDDYSPLRETAFATPHGVIRDLHLVIPKIKIDPTGPDTDSATWWSRMKSIVMKLIQLAVYHIDHSINFEKDKIATDSRKIVERYALLATASLVVDDSAQKASLFWLFRGKDGEYNPALVKFLIDVYFAICREVGLSD